MVIIITSKFSIIISYSLRMTRFLALTCVVLLCVCSATESVETVIDEPVDEEDVRADRRLNGGRKRINTSSTNRIVGGSPAGAETYPFIVSLYDRNNPGNMLPVCGEYSYGLETDAPIDDNRLTLLLHPPTSHTAGSLITPSVVLTAAHCIIDIQSAEIGRYDYLNDESGVETYTNLVRRRHPQYNADTFDYDYALIKLDREQPDPYLVSLRKTPGIPLNMTIMGWGQTSEDGDQANELMEADVRKFDTTQCRTNYDPEPITDNMFCASEDGIDACQGDSGGPIIATGTNIQLGVTSWGVGCGNATFPGVFARVEKGYAWIEETVCTDLSPEDCYDDDTLPIVDLEGVALAQTCEDREDFLGLGQKLFVRNCTWVQGRRDRRCRWYGEDFCPATCEIERCANATSV
jgi:trypsin